MPLFSTDSLFSLPLLNLFLISLHFFLHSSSCQGGRKSWQSTGSLHQIRITVNFRVKNTRFESTCIQYTFFLHSEESYSMRPLLPPSVQSPLFPWSSLPTRCFPILWLCDSGDGGWRWWRMDNVVWILIRSMTPRLEVLLSSMLTLDRMTKWHAAVSVISRRRHQPRVIQGTKSAGKSVIVIELHELAMARMCLFRGRSNRREIYSGKEVYKTRREWKESKIVESGRSSSYAWIFFIRWNVFVLSCHVVLLSMSQNDPILFLNVLPLKHE